MNHQNCKNTTFTINRIAATAILVMSASLYAISCSDNPASEQQTPTGTIEVVMVTTGGDDAPYGYTLSIQGGQSLDIDPDGTTTLTNIPEGSYTIQLSNIAPHCEAVSQSSQSASVVENQTATVQFEVDCKAILRDKIVFLIRVEGQDYQIHAMDTDGDNMIQISNMTVSAFADLSISPDGLKIVFAAPDPITNFNQIWVMNADGTGLSNLTQSPTVTNVFPRWSPDGTQIAFASNRDNAFRDLFVMNSDGSDVRNLTNDSVTVVSYSDWSSDGQRLIFDTTEPGTPNHFRLETIHINGTDRAIFLDEGSGVVLSKPNWAVNGMISFERFIQNAGDIRQIYITDENRSFEHSLMEAAGYQRSNSFHAAWAPDASKLAFYIPAGGGIANIYTAAPDGSGFERISSSAGGISKTHPAWSPYTRNR